MLSADPAARTAPKGVETQWQRLRSRWGGAVAQGVLWTTGGYGLAQVLRFQEAEIASERSAGVVGFSFRDLLEFLAALDARAQRVDFLSRRSRRAG